MSEECWKWVSLKVFLTPLLSFHRVPNSHSQMYEPQVLLSLKVLFDQGKDKLMDDLYQHFAKSAHIREPVVISKNSLKL